MCILIYRYAYNIEVLNVLMYVQYLVLIQSHSVKKNLISLLCCLHLSSVQSTAISHNNNSAHSLLKWLVL